MKKITKLLLLLLVLTSITVLRTIVPNNVFADEITDDQVLLDANFSEETVNTLSDFTKGKIAAQIKASRGFNYRFGTLTESDDSDSRSLINSSKMTFIATSSVTKVDGAEIKEVTVRIYYEWKNLPTWRLEDPIIASWTYDTYSYKSGSIHVEDHYKVGSTDYTFVSSNNFSQKNQNTICWLADLKGYNVLSNCKALYGFGEFILTPKDNSKYFAIGELNAIYMHSIGSQTNKYNLGSESGYEITDYNGFDHVNLSTDLTWQTPVTLSGADYGFPNSYCSTETTKEHTFNNSILVNNFTTKRLRCGYINNTYLMISPKQNDAGTAYLEYQFIEPVYEIIVDLSFYSANEYIITTDSTAALQYKDTSGNWVTLIDLFNDVTLPTDPTQPTTFTFMFPENVRHFRFYASTTNPIGTRPKGRICIGDIKIFGEL